VTPAVAIVMPIGDRRGGAQAMLLDLVREGSDNGVRWLPILLEDGPLAVQLRATGNAVEVIQAGRIRQPSHFASTVARIARYGRAREIVAVLGWMAKGQLYGGLAARVAGVPAVWFQHGLPERRSGIDRIATMLPARAILTCSRASAQAQSSLRPHRPVRVVYPGIELGRFDPGSLATPAEARRRLRLPEAGPIVGMVGRLQRWKGMHVLVQAMPAVLARYPLAHCVIVGGSHHLEPDYSTFLRAQIRARGLEERVLLVGPQYDVPLWMQAMDVIVHASDQEPFGIVVIEAMALAKPVVATDRAGPREIVTHGIDGFLTPYGDPNSLARAILRYLDDPALADRMGRAARARAGEFSAARFAGATADALLQIVGSG
jgi:glycosyltransferase involved in cell wall biosynthesis